MVTTHRFQLKLQKQNQVRFKSPPPPQSRGQSANYSSVVKDKMVISLGVDVLATVSSVTKTPQTVTPPVMGGWWREDEQVPQGGCGIFSKPFGKGHTSPPPQTYRLEAISECVEGLEL